MGIGKLEPVSLRSIWKHEEYDFSSWLEDNIDLISNSINLELTVVQRERRVGSFQVDIVAEDSDGNLVVIENQLEPTNHDHLGKILTYLSNLDAKTAIWIVSEPRPEHVNAITWLNEATPADVSFYLIKLAAYRIGDSKPAPLLTTIAGPNEETKDFGRQKKDLAERHVLRLRFWEQLLTMAKKKEVNLHIHKNPTKNMWLGTGAGKAGLSYNYLIWIDEKTGVELYIDTGDQERNKQMFDELYKNKEAIENTFQKKLEWERLDEKRASRIKYTINMGGLKADEESWPQIQEEMINSMNQFYKAFSPYVKLL
jgi:hypothetical protein